MFCVGNILESMNFKHTKPISIINKARERERRKLEGATKRTNEYGRRQTMYSVTSLRQNVNFLLTLPNNGRLCSVLCFRHAPLAILSSPTRTSTNTIVSMSRKFVSHFFCLWLVSVERTSAQSLKSDRKSCVHSSFIIVFCCLVLSCSSSSCFSWWFRAHKPRKQKNVFCLNGTTIFVVVPEYSFSAPSA